MNDCQQIGGPTLQTEGEGFEAGESEIHTGLLDLADVTQRQAAGPRQLVLCPTPRRPESSQVVGQQVADGGTRVSNRAHSVKVPGRSQPSSVEDPEAGFFIGAESGE
jgi:hypothetical protein